jgi:ribosomal protein L24
MKLPHYISRKSWHQGDRVVVAVGQFKGKHGTVTLRAEKNNYLVLLDGEKRPRQFLKGALDPE